MILTAVAEQGYFVPWLLLLFASAGVFHHSGIKIPFFAFFAHDSGIRVQEAPKNMLIAMGIAAFFCIGIGVFPQPLYAMLPYPVDYHPYTTYHVINQLQLLLFSALAFTWLMRTGVYPPELRSTNLDFDVVYRKGLPALVRGLIGFYKPVDQALRKGAVSHLSSRHCRALSLLGSGRLACTRAWRRQHGFLGADDACRLSSDLARRRLGLALGKFYEDCRTQIKPALRRSSISLDE